MSGTVVFESQTLHTDTTGAQSPNVRVVLIEPGAVSTELNDHIAHAGTKQVPRPNI